MVKINPDRNVVKIIKERLEQNDGYCPCATFKDDSTKCMCEEFKELIKDPNFKGQCHCGLYIKE